MSEADLHAADDSIVVVTGASGYVGSYVVKELLELGYRVRATVRNADDESKTRFLRELVPNPKYPLEIFSADLTTEGSFDAAVEGATVVIHTAAVVSFAVDDPERNLIGVTMAGVKNILSSCRKAARARTLKRFVHTSSIAAILNDDIMDRRDGYVFTESDWNNCATTDPYSKSKVLSERYVDEFFSSLSTDEWFSFVCINPATIFGPLLNPTQVSGSPQIVRDLMSGVYPFAPNLDFALVDVRDVAHAHVVAMVNRHLSGRFIVSNQNYPLIAVATMMREQFPQYKIPKSTIPNFFMYAAALFDKRLTFRFLWTHLDAPTYVSNQRSKRELGLAYRDIKTSVQETCQTLIDLGVVPVLPRAQ